MARSNIAQNNANWLARDYQHHKQKKRKTAREFTKYYNGKSPQLKLENDEIKWDRPTKYGQSI